jgi:hypothetical protein
MARPFAKLTPTRRAPISPGAQVTATASISLFEMPAFFSASSESLPMTAAWLRDAISGTTPPYIACISACEKSSLESVSRPFLITATAVSSQDVSIAIIVI